MTTTDTQAPNYETRICSTALVLRTFKNENYTILIQNLRGHRGWILPNGKIEAHETSIESALREFNEETGGILNAGAELRSIGNIGTLSRQAGTSPRNDTERSFLDQQPQGKKFLFLKQQGYEVFVVDGLNNKQVILDASQRVKDIENCQIIKITPGDHSRYSDVINNPTDLEVVKTLTDYLGQSNKSLETLESNIDELRNQLSQYTDTIFE